MTDANATNDQPLKLGGTANCPDCEDIKPVLCELSRVVADLGSALFDRQVYQSDASLERVSLERRTRH